MPTPVAISPPPDARHLLFHGLIDYAGLFPPSSLDMEKAVAEYRSARASSQGWIVDHFIVPASRLDELAVALVPTFDADEEPWPLALLVDLGDWPRHQAAHAAAAGFVGQLDPAVRFELAEIRVATSHVRLAVEAIEAAQAFSPLGAVTYFELPLEVDFSSAVEALASARADAGIRLGAKLRCGGLSAEMFPTPHQVAGFIVACRDAGLPFKCTAGLHHPVRHDDHETGFTHHGFLNLVGATLFAAEGADRDQITEVVAERNPETFRLRAYGFGWNDTWIPVEVIARVREHLFTAYGSCSFEEPVNDLAVMGALP